MHCELTVFILLNQRSGGGGGGGGGGGEWPGESKMSGWRGRVWTRDEEVGYSNASRVKAREPLGFMTKS